MSLADVRQISLSLSGIRPNHLRCNGREISGYFTRFQRHFTGFPALFYGAFHNQLCETSVKDHLLRKSVIDVLLESSDSTA
jgi:hypothetical protein